MPPNQLIPPPHDPHSPFFPSLCFLLLQQHLCNLSRGHHRLVRPPASQHSDTPPPPPTVLPPNKFNSGPQKGKGRKRERERVTERGWLANKNNLCRLGLIALLCLAQREKQVLCPYFSPLCLYHTGCTFCKENEKERHGCWGVKPI